MVATGMVDVDRIAKMGDGIRVPDRGRFQGSHCKETVLNAIFSGRICGLLCDLEEVLGRRGIAGRYTWRTDGWRKYSP